MFLCGYLPFAAQRFVEHKDTTGTVTDVFTVFTPVMRRCHGLRGPLVSKQLQRLLVHTDNRIRLIIGTLVYFKHVFPAGDELGVSFRGYTPAVFQMGF